MINRFLISIILIITSIKASWGSPYFQQRVEYHIEVRLDDQEHLLTGQIRFRYHNHSPDTLRMIKMHLWPNAYSGRNTALCKQLLVNNDASLFFASKKENGWIDSLNFSADGSVLTLVADRQHPDIADLLLNKPLLPGESILISSPFRVKIPDSKFSRFGHHENDYFISQWYPKPAVYDRNGWHAMPYLDQGEFYSEFGKFTVSITLPDDYRVAATGRLTTATEISFLDELAKLEEAGTDATDTIASATEKTIVFEQDSIHDFAWFASRKYRVLKQQVPVSGSRNVDAWVFFTGKKAELWKNAIHYSKSGLQFLSKSIGEYPFPHFTVVDGTISAGGGMEYPMITIINTPSSPVDLERVVVHELAHNWFYGILATNERRHAWMDEGFTSYFEVLYLKNEYGEQGRPDRGSTLDLGPINRLVDLTDITPFKLHQLTYQFASAGNRDQPLNLPSDQFTYLNYGAVVYSKSVLALDFLHQYLGDSLFMACVREYFNQWQFRHPQPEDLRMVFEKTSGKDLRWFFDGLLNTIKPEKYKIESPGLESETGKTTLGSGSPSEVPVQIVDGTGKQLWVEGFTGEKTIRLPFEPSEPVSLNSRYSTLFKTRPVFYNTRGKKKRNAINPRMFYSITDKPGKNNLVILPVVAWNRYNQWMPGVHLTNMNLIPKPFEFFLTPIYDFKSGTPAGTVRLHYNHAPYSGLFSGVSFSVEAKRFAYAENKVHSDSLSGSQPVFSYMKLAPSVVLNLRKSNPRSTITQSIGYRNVNVWIDEIKYTRTVQGFDKDFQTPSFNFNELMYSVSNSRIIDPWSASSVLQQGKDHVKITGEFNYRFSYRKKNKGIDVRLFAGAFLKNETLQRNYNLRLSGWSGTDDYLFDDYFFGRTDISGLWDNQFMVKEGGFKINTAIGQTRDWLAAVNIMVDLPVPIPVRFYFDAGTFKGIENVIEEYSKKVAYNGGAAVVLIKNTLEVYVPLFMSKDIEQNLKTNNVKFADRIRFVFNIKNLAPDKLRNDTIKKL